MPIVRGEKKRRNKRGELGAPRLDELLGKRIVTYKSISSIRLGYPRQAAF